MKYIFLISSLFQFLDFAVPADDPLEDYYKSIAVLDVYHEKFTTHLQTEYLQLGLGSRSVDYSTTTLLFEEEETNVPDLVMRKDDIRWNHLYLSATPYVPLTLIQNFANGFAWFASFREMLNFRVGALYYKRKEKNELAKHCSMMAAYFTMFQLILKQQRLYEFSNIIDNYNKEKTYSLISSFLGLKPVKDSTSAKKEENGFHQNIVKLFSRVREKTYGEIVIYERKVGDDDSRFASKQKLVTFMPDWWAQPTKKDALATAKNMELLSEVTEVLYEVMDYRTVRRQYPVQPSDPHIFPTNEEQAKTRMSAIAVVKETLASDFYLQEAPEEGGEGAELAKTLEGLGLKEPSSEISHGGDLGPLEEIESQRQPTEKPVETNELKEQASSSKASEEMVVKKEQISEQEKEILWRKHSEDLKTIDQKYNLLEEDNEAIGMWNHFRPSFLERMVRVEKWLKTVYAYYLLYRKYYRYVWKELLAIYGDAFVRVTEYFQFAVSGRSYRSTVEKWTDTFEDYVPNMDESLAIWEKAEELLVLTKEDYQLEDSNREKGWKSHPITVLQSIEKIRYSNRIKDAVIDEQRIRKKWTLEYVNPQENPADLKVV